MILYIVPLIYILFNIKKRPVSFYLFFLYAATLYLGLLVDHTIIVKNPEDGFNCLFCALSFFIVYHSFSKHCGIRTVNTISFGKEGELVLRVVKYIGIICFLINIYVSIKLFSVFFGGDIFIDEFKNGDGGSNGDIVSTFINPGLLTLTRIFSPFSYVCMGLHFYYMSISDKKNSFLFLLGALNVLLVSLTSLSRSSFLIFAIMYFFYLVLLYPAFNNRVKTIVRRSVLVLGGGIFFVFLALTQNRFAETIPVGSKGIIKDPVTSSIVDYASQAHDISIIVLRQYDSENKINPPTSTALYNYICERFLNKHRETKAFDDRERKYGFYSSAFTNAPCQLVFEWGYGGTLLIFILFFLFVRSKAPRKGVITLNKILWFCPLVTFAGMGILADMLAFTMFHLGVLYVGVISLILKKYSGRKIPA